MLGEVFFELAPASEAGTIAEQHEGRKSGKYEPAKDEPDPS